MSNSNICAECSTIHTYHLCAICNNALLYPICLCKRGYDDLNYCPCVSYDPNTKSASNIKEATTNEPNSKYLKLANCENASTCAKTNSTNSMSSLST